MQVPNQPTTNEKNVNRSKTSEAARQAHVAKWKQSGLSMSEYCRRNGLPVPSLSRWVQATQTISPAFKPVTIQSKRPEEKMSSTVEIITEDHIKLRLLNVGDASFIVSILKGLKACS